MTQEQPEALPCPFCGSEPSITERPDNIDGTEFFCAVACFCGGYSACAHKMARRETPEQAKGDAIAAWNRRAEVQRLSTVSAPAVPPGFKLPEQPSPPYFQGDGGRNVVALGAAMKHAETYAKLCVRLALAGAASVAAGAPQTELVEKVPPVKNPMCEWPWEVREVTPAQE